MANQNRFTHLIPQSHQWIGSLLATVPKSRLAPPQRQFFWMRPHIAAGAAFLR